MLCTTWSPLMNNPALELPAASRQRFEAVCGTIRERISLLDYLPGQRLSEEALAEEFGTSRTPIRRVLARLEDEGLLRSVQSVGTIVTDVDVETLAQTYRLRMELAELIGRLDPIEPSSVDVRVFRDLQARIDALKCAPVPENSPGSTSSSSTRSCRSAGTSRFGKSASDSIFAPRGSGYSPSVSSTWAKRFRSSRARLPTSSRQSRSATSP